MTETLLDRLDLAEPDERTLEAAAPAGAAGRGPYRLDPAVEPADDGADHDHRFVSERVGP